MQAQADLAQVPVDVYPSAHATAARRRRVRPARRSTPALTVADAAGELDAGAHLRAAVERRPRRRPPRPLARRRPRPLRRAARDPLCRNGSGGRADGPYDVAVIGAGLVGAAIARDLAGAHLRVALVEAPRRRRRRHEQGQHRDPAHRFRRDARARWSPGSSAAATELLRAYAADTGIPVEPTGAPSSSRGPTRSSRRCPRLRGQGVAQRLRRLRARRRRRGLPPLPAPRSGRARRPRRARTSRSCAPGRRTWPSPPRPVRRGADLLLRHEVTRCAAGPGRHHDPATRRPGTVRARWVVNAAGLGADVLDRLFGHDRFTVVPRRGELLVFDKLARPLAPRIVLPVPSTRRQGRAREPDDLRQRHARPHRRGPRRPHRRPAPPRTGSSFLLAKGAPAHARPARRRRSPRPTRGCGRRTDARRLPRRGRRRAALPARRRHPLHRAHRLPGPRRARRGACCAAAGLDLDRRATTCPPAADAQPRRGRSPAPTRRRRDRAPTRSTAGSSASASGSRAARCATRSPRRSRRATSTACAAAPALMNGRCQGFYCGAEVGRPARAGPRRQERARVTATGTARRRRRRRRRARPA